MRARACSRARLTLSLNSSLPLLIVALFTLLPRPSSLARPGQVDTNFNAGTGADAPVRAVLNLPQDKLIIAGDFTSFNQLPAARIARLNPDGSLDSAFHASFNDSVYALLAQPDGKLLVGGAFTNASGNSRSRIARLLADGSLDTSFDPGAGPDGPIHCLALQSDGKILIGGTFRNVNGTPREVLARLEGNGALDSTFIPATESWVSSILTSIALYRDGRILAAGDFVTAGVRGTLARLKPSGAVDDSFDRTPGLPFSLMGEYGYPTFRCLRTGDDGSALVGGEFVLRDYLAHMYDGLLRIDQAGEPDPSFAPEGVTPGPISSMIVQNDGKILCVGHFRRPGNGPGSRGIVRLFPDGQIDPTFDDLWSEIGDIPEILSADLNSRGELVIAGDFSSIQGIAAGRIARLLNDAPVLSGPVAKAGLADVTNYLGVAEFSLKTEWYSASPISIQWRHNGALIPGATGLSLTLTQLNLGQQGLYTVEVSNAFGSASSSGFLTIAPPPVTPGSLDPSLNVPARLLLSGGQEGAINAAAVQRNGQILLGGNFSYFVSNGVTRFATPPNAYGSLIRITLNGAPDSSFRPVLASSSGTPMVLTIGESQEGRILVGGQFSSANGIPLTNLARFFPDGTLDQQFAVRLTSPGRVAQIIEQPDGKILVRGDLSSLNNPPRSWIARLRADGTFDETFDVGLGPNGPVRSMALLPDGKIIAGGDFTRFAGISKPYLVRLHPNGQLDTSFDSGFGPNAAVYYVTALRNGGVIISGGFSRYDNESQYSAARLTSSGRLDPAFNPSRLIFNLLEEESGEYVVQFGSEVARINARGEQDTSFTKASLSFDGLNTPKLLRETSGDLLVPGAIIRQAGLERRYLARLFDREPKPSAPVLITPPSASASYEQHLGALATGFPPPSYQWFLNSKPIPGATNQSYDLWRPTPANSGAYSVTIRNSVGSVSSVPLPLSFGHAPAVAGAIDREFVPPIADGYVLGMAVQLDNKIVIVGTFTNVNGIPRRYVARLLPDGEVDASFEFKERISPNSVSLPYANLISPGLDGVGIQSGGKIIISGRFNLIGDFKTDHLARLNPDGTLDRTFNPTHGPDLVELGAGALAIGTGGEIIVPAAKAAGGRFLTLARLDKDGAFDATFHPSILELQHINSIVLAQAEDMFVAGNSLYHVARNGGTTLLAAFSPTATDKAFTSLAAERDGSIVVGSIGTPSGSGNKLQRYKPSIFGPSGVLDDTYAPAIPESGRFASALLLQNDGKLIVLQNRPYSFQPDSRLNRLTTQGQIDASFLPPITDGQCLAFQRGQLLIGTSTGVQRVFTDTSPILSASFYINGDVVRLIVSWPEGLQGFTLESTPSLTNPVWTRVSYGGNSASIPWSPGAKGLFVRLRK